MRVGDVPADRIDVPRPLVIEQHRPLAPNESSIEPGQSEQVEEPRIQMRRVPRRRRPAIRVENGLQVEPGHRGA